jgi:hypothetical protein
MKVIGMAGQPLATAQEPGRVQQVELPAEARALSTLARIDYHDAFAVEAGRGQDRTAEQWARAVLEGAPLATRKALSRGWSALGLRLGPVQSAERVLGWEIRRCTQDAALLGAGGRLGLAGELLFLRQQDTLLYATFVQLDNPGARAVWAGTSARHRQIVAQLLEQAIPPGTP